MFQEALKGIGVDMKLEVVDFTIAVQRTVYSSNFDAIYMSWDLSPDPDLFPIFHSSQMPPHGQNYVGYLNKDADRLIEEGRRAMDQSKRADIYKQLHTIIADDQPYTWITQPSLKWAVNRRIKGVKTSNGFGLFSWYPGELEWWVTAPPRISP
jgi:peptide/nickel transport system substrate-binding protein